MKWEKNFRQSIKKQQINNKTNKWNGKFEQDIYRSNSNM